MAVYKGAASDGGRAASLLKKRERSKQEFEFMKQKIRDTQTLKVEAIESKYGQSNYDAVEEELKSSTVGLVTLTEMKAKRESLVRDRGMQAACETEVVSEEEHKVCVRETEKDKRYPNVNKSLLSFDLDESSSEGESESREVKRVKICKDPTVDTSFLPDKDREEAETLLREELRQEWLSQQEKLKSEQIRVTYSYWDGSGHRRQSMMKKGDTIERFLQGCIESLRGEFHELRVSSVENLMYIKEDIILPHYNSFYDFIVAGARGKSGPLFQFDVHDDVRLMSDASVEREESHAGKVCLRSWYERNKHIFPASRWEPYDPEKKWEKYTNSDTARTKK